MNIVYSCDEGFAKHCAAGITSVFENNTLEEDVTVYVLGINLTYETCLRFKNLGEIYLATGRMDLSSSGGLVPPGFKRSVEVIDAGDFAASLSLITGKSFPVEKFPAAAMARIFAPSYLPDGVEKYLYLDSDTIVRKPLHMMYGTNLSGKVCGMVPEPTIYPEIRTKLGLSGDAPYYNSGVMLVDRMAWEKMGITGKCIDFYKENGQNLNFPDQDMLNHVLSGEIKTLPPTFNFFTNYHYRSYGSLIRRAKWYKSCVSFDEYSSARENPAVVHFAGDERPWREGNSNSYAADYNRYLKMSPWTDSEAEKGHEKELKLYHAMNVVTGACPAIRDLISDYYYRKNLKK